MNLRSLELIYFSPTKTTKRVLEGIAQGMDADAVEHIDLSPPETATRAFEEMHDQRLALIGAPVYDGRLPLVAVHRLQRLKGSETPAVIVVVYGNRAYEDALLELRDLVAGAGFIPVAGGAFIGEHSFASADKPVALGRPDAEDLANAGQFGSLIQSRLTAIKALDELPPLRVPGNFPFKEGKPPAGVPPVTREGLCSRCGTCATVCPTGVVTVGDTVTVEPAGCILCCACIKNCPTGARVGNALIEQFAERLSAKCRERKQPELYLAADKAP